MRQILKGQKKQPSFAFHRFVAPWYTWPGNPLWLFPPLSNLLFHQQITNIQLFLLLHHLVLLKWHPVNLTSVSTCQDFECDKKRKRQHAGFTFMVCCSTWSWSSWNWSSSSCCKDRSFSLWASTSWDWAWVSFCSREQTYSDTNHIKIS